MQKMFLILTTLFFFQNHSYANDVAITQDMIPNQVVIAILKAECHFNLNKCNHYQIAFNEKRDIKKAKNHHFKVEGRVLFCGTTMGCQKDLSSLEKMGITNLDLGPFQINYKMHREEDTSIYFEYEKAKKKACSFLATLINKYGYSWQTLGRYHSSTPKLNKKYYKKLYYAIYNKEYPRSK